MHINTFFYFNNNNNIILIKNINANEFEYMHYFCDELLLLL
jgi:hypothetical protein